MEDAACCSSLQAWQIFWLFGESFAKGIENLLDSSLADGQHMRSLRATRLLHLVKSPIEITPSWKVVLLEALSVWPFDYYSRSLYLHLASRTRDPDIEMVNYEGAMHRFRIGRLSYPKIPQWYLSIKMWFYQPGVSVYFVVI